MSRIEDAVSETNQGVILTIEVSAGSRQNRFPAGYDPWRNAILCRVPEPPRKGQANAAVLVLIAKILEIPPSSLQIQSGATSSLKKIHVAGKTKSGVVQILSRLVE